MKKYALLFIVINILVLMACAKTSDENVEIGIANEESSFVSLTFSSGATNVTTSDDGVYVFNSRTDGKVGGNIFYVDSKTKDMVYLCNRVECVHIDETCTSWVADPACYIFMNSQKDLLFLVVTQYIDEKQIYSIYTIEQNGENRRLIYSLPAQEKLQFEKVFIQANDEIYFISEIEKEVEDNIYLQYRLNRLDYKEKIINFVADYDEPIQLLGGTKSGLIALTQKFIPDKERGMKSEVAINSLSVDSGNLSEIYGFDSYPRWEGYVPTTLYLYQNRMFLAMVKNKSQCEFEVVDLTTRKKTKLCSFDAKGANSEGFVGGFDNHLILESYTNEFGIYRIAVDVQTGETRELTMEMESADDMKFFVGITAETQSSFFVVNRTRTATSFYIGPQNELVETTARVSSYAFIKKDDYFNNVPQFENIADFEL